MAPAVIWRAVWLRLRFALSYRDAENLPAERGIDASWEAGRRRALRFAAACA